MSGFDIVLGNPPWEHMELKEKEWFVSRNEEIVAAGTASKRKELIQGLKASDPLLFQEFSTAKRMIDGARHFCRESGRFPMCGRGRTNLYAVFSELFSTSLGQRGRSGCLVPSGISTDDTTKFFFQSIVEGRKLVSLFDFENRAGLFRDVDSRMKFSALTLGGSSWPTVEADFSFFAHQVEDLDDPERRFTLTAEDIALVNPNTRTCPIFRTRRDAEITKGIYRRVPVLVDEAKGEEGNPWGVKFKQGLFNMSSDSSLFHTREQLEGDSWTLDGNVFSKAGEQMLPLYEAKMIHHFDHQWATYEGTEKSRLFTEQEKRNPGAFTLPRYWVAEEEVNTRLEKVAWNEDWLMGWRDICRSTDERTLVNGLIPRAAVGHKILLAFLQNPKQWCELNAIWSSFPCDFVARQKVGGTSFTYFTMRQIPILTPDQIRGPAPWTAAESCIRWIQSRVSKLLPFGWVGVSGTQVLPASKRFELRVELHAAMFHLYGIERDDVDYIMETFPIVKRKDVNEFGTYRTKERILQVYDQMATCQTEGTTWESPLQTPPEAL
jgi:hypothetical protein